MRPPYKAQWISKSGCDALRRSRRSKDIVLLDTFKGFIVVEPTGKTLGDGDVLSAAECDYELRPAWYSGPLTRLAEARQRLGLASRFPGRP
jgi:hypothetical protein